MLSEIIIYIIHLFLFVFLISSPFIDNCEYKKLSFIFLFYLFVQYLLKYGKCGFINIERIFLKENFKNGILFKLIKPIICYKRNPIYYEYLYILVLYLIILFIQIKKKNCKLY